MRKSRRALVGASGLLALALAAPTWIGSAQADRVDNEGATAGTTLPELIQQAQEAQEVDGRAPAGKPQEVPGDERQVEVAGETVEVADAAPVQGRTDLPPTLGGQWNHDVARLPTPSVHSVLLNSGKVLLIAGSQNDWSTFDAGRFTSTLWDPQTNTFKQVPTPYDMFCAGHVVLQDGRVLIAGGTTSYPVYDEDGTLVQDWGGSKESYIFDPISETYQKTTNEMSVGRWYQTMVRMGDNRVVTVAGLDENHKDTPVNEVFTPAPGSTWDRFAGGSWSRLPRERQFPQYAHLVLMDDGRLFYTGQSTGNTGLSPGIWDPYTDRWTDVPGLPNLWQRNAGGSVLLPPAQDQKVLTFGGGDWQLPSLKDAHVVDLKDPAKGYQKVQDIANGKMYAGAVVLPDYTVLQTNGAASFREDAVRDAQIYFPKLGSWTTVNSPTVDRLYHSSALLLPDGRVATFGSQVVSGEHEMRISVFSPPYLFKGQRPAILDGPTYIDYNTSAAWTWEITKESGTTISRVSLTRPSATTHSTDTEQRLVDIPFTQTPTSITLNVPDNRNLTPPGWYMLTLLDAKGRPSVSKWVSLN